MRSTPPVLLLAGRLLIIGSVGLLAGSTCNDEEFSDFFTPAEKAQIQTLTNLPAVPPSTTNAFADNAAAAALGKQYFFDARFSSSGTVSCSRCHNPATGFADQATVPANVSEGVGFTGRNAPSIYNVAFQTFYFWDGRKDSLWSQALGPTESSVEHNGNRVAFAMVIRDRYIATGQHDEVFGPLPAEIADLGGVTYPFPTPPAAAQFPTQGRPGDSLDPLAGTFATYDGLPTAHKNAVDLVFSHFGKAIEAYERLVLSTNSPFDRFAAGEGGAMSVSAQRGLKLFLGKGQCINCHSGPNFTDNQFHNIGVTQLGHPVQVPTTDEGRFNGVLPLLADPFNGAGVFSDDTVAGAAKLAGLNQNPSLHGLFKTTTLRSVNETAPYMHTGHITELRGVILFYARGGDTLGFVGANELVPFVASSQEVDDLVAFLEALEGEDLPAAVTDVPVLPP